MSESSDIGSSFYKSASVSAAGKKAESLFLLVSVNILRKLIIIMISSTIKTALTQLFDMGIEYMTLIQHNQDRYFIVIGSTSLLFLKEGFDVLEAKVSFQCIDRLVVSCADIYLF